MPETKTPNCAHLLDTLLAELKIKNDARLSRRLGITASHLCKLRSGQLPMSAEVLLRIYDRTDYSIEQLRKLLAVQPAG